jgi:hypothetical protein
MQPSHQPVAGSIRQTEMQGDGTAVADGACAVLGIVEVRDRSNRGADFRTVAAYEFLSTPLAKIYERGVSPIPTIRLVERDD